MALNSGPPPLLTSSPSSGGNKTEPPDAPRDEHHSMTKASPVSQMSLSSLQIHQNQAPSAPSGPEQISRGVFTARLSRRHDKLTASWNESQLLRSQVQTARERLQRYQVSFRDSRRLYNDALDTMSSRYTSTFANPNLNSLRDRVDDDRARVENQVAECLNLEERLKRRENVLQRREADFMEAAKDLMSLTEAPSTGDFFAHLANSRLGMPGTPASPLSVQVDPLLEKYYDKAAEVKLVGEQLVDLDYTFEEEMGVRGLQQDHGEVMVISDEEFQAEFLRKRALVESELDLVISDADRLRAECDAAGLDIHAYQRRVPDSDVMTDPGDLEDKIAVAGLPPVGIALTFETLNPELEVIRPSPNSETLDKPLERLDNAGVLSWVEGLEIPERPLKDLRRVSDQLNLDGNTLVGSPAPDSQRLFTDAEKRLSESNLRSLAPIPGNRQDVFNDLTQT